MARRAEADINLNINAVDNASRVIQKTNGEFATMSKIGAGARDFVRGLGVDFDMMINPAQLAGQAVLEVGKYIKSSVDDFTAYGKEVGDVARQLGVSAEEASLLIQVSDDLEISFESLRLGLRQAQQKGFTPTLEGLKSIREEYIALKDPTEQAAFAMDVFGSRAGLEMQKLLERTTDELDDFAQGAYEAGLVLSDDGVKAAEEYRLAMDGLNDSVDGLKMQIGEEFLPVFQTVVNAMNDGISAAKENADRIDNIREAYQKGYITLEEYREATAGLKHGQWEYNETAQRASELIDNLESSMSDTTLETGALRNATLETADAIEVELTPALEEEKLTLDGVNDRMKKYTTELLYNKAAAGLDADAALALAHSLGLVDERTEFMLTEVDSIKAYFDTNKDGLLSADEAAKGYDATIAGLDRKLRDLPSDIPINVKINVSQSGNLPAYVRPGGKDAVVQAYANGGDFYTNGPQLIMVGDNPGGREHVRVDPVGGGQAVTNNWNINMQSNAPSSTIIRDLNMLQARAI
jgi:hypothetical protein